jgi:L-ascorbate metabolism protein UlaG (beta-lactamase superfamily)
MACNPQLEILVPTAQLAFSADRLGCHADRFRHLDAGESLRSGSFEFHAITAAHDDVDRDENGHCMYLGYVIQFGDWTLYHSGDTIPHHGLAEQLERFSIDVAILPINGRAPERRVSGNFWGTEAAALAHKLGVKLVIPCHYHMFSFNSVTPDEFVSACHRLQQPYCILRSGERWESVGRKPG